ncbi:hypothetical protein [uncultured Acetatifactor sp.]|uniref:hypothetical protein n=1 Tax=uncultured Acetatifactor sp. TaxID=1671927 RepID=UPI0026F40792|nr:hypothetical protein [uncultured Acetatifactor sp.]
MSGKKRHAGRVLVKVWEGDSLQNRVPLWEGQWEGSLQIWIQVWKNWEGAFLQIFT